MIKPLTLNYFLRGWVRGRNAKSFTLLLMTAKVIPIDEELVRVRQGQPNYIRIHVYLGTVCRCEVFDKARPFDLNKKDILEAFGIAKKLDSNEKQEEREKYCLKLVNGGLIDSNNLVFHDDRVMILPREEFLK